MTQGFLTYTTREGDRWDLIAWDHYGVPFAYEPIIQANPHAPIAPLLPGGLTLLIPLRDAAPATAGLPPWKRALNGGGTP